MKTSNTTQTRSPICTALSYGTLAFQPVRWLLVFAACLFGAASLHAADQTWTNAPVDGNWANTNNWVGQAAPGVVNVLAQDGTLNAVNNDTATFNSPIYNGIGGAGNPIIPDDGTVTNSRSRTLGSIIFDTANCGAYVFYSPSAPVFTSTNQPETGFLNLCHDGSVTMNASVTNPETFLIPIAIRLPSSTWGSFNFVNNSTTPTATLFINGVTNYSADTRSTTFYLGGSNTGTNTIGGISRGTTTSSGALQGIVKQGTGTWILTGTNDFSGNYITIAINEGLLAVKDPGAFGTSSSATVNSNGILEVDGVTLGQSTINLQGQGMLKMNGSANVNGVTVGTAVSDSPSLATTSSGDVMTVLTNNGGDINNTLHITGPGTVQLAGGGSYVGTWSVDAGTCSITNADALDGSHMATVGAGGTLDLSPLGAVTYAWAPTRMGGSGTGTTVGSTAATITAAAGATIDLASGANGITLTYTPTSFSGDATHPALYMAQGTLSLGNNAFVINNASGTPLGAGTYVLIHQASGSITSAGGYVADVEGSGTAAGTLGTIQVTGGDVDLVVAPYTKKNLVWKGGNPDNTWDNSTTANWLNGGSPSVFNVSDDVLFNSTGSSYATVNLVGTLSPSSVTVDTSGNDYTFSGSGYIAGGTGLSKIGTGTLTIQTADTYSGDTVVSNGTLQLGADNVIPGGLSSGQVAVHSPGVLDMNAFSDSIGALNGDGTVDSSGSGTSTLTVGNNNATGTFSGTIKNTSGTVGVTKNGAGTQTFSGVNSYTGPTVINAGTLSIGSGSPLASSTLTLNGGTLDLGANMVVSNWSGAVGTTIANNSSASPVTIYTHGTGLNTSSLIADGTGGGPVSIVVLDGSLVVNEANTYSGGTYVASGATFGVGVINHVNGGQAGSGDIVASNNATITIPTAVSTGEYLNTPVTTVDGATATFLSGETGNAWQNPFNGSATATNIFSGGSASFAANMQFSNFLGTVIITNGTIRNYQHGGPVGGLETSFEFVNGGGMYNRSSGQDVVLGSLSGLGGIIGDSHGGNYYIGSNNRSTHYSGGFTGPDNIIKSGTGTLTFDGGGQLTTNVSSPDGGITFVTNYSYGTNMIMYTGTTTVSNGVLALAAPSILTNSPTVTLAASTAVLDASSMGYISNQVSGGTTNQFAVTNGIFELVSGQTLQGMGTLKSTTFIADAGSTMDIGLPTGSLTNTGNVELAGAINMNVDATGTPNSSELIAPSFAIDSTATLVVSNAGPEQAATFQLFNHAVNTNLFASIVLPTLSGTNHWINNLGVDGSITMVAPQPVQPTPVITGVSISGTTLNITATNGAFNGNYSVLESTNLATPLSNWVQVVTGTFDASGNLNLSTNIVNSAKPQDFYILSQ